MWRGNAEVLLGCTTADYYTLWLTNYDLHMLSQADTLAGIQSGKAADAAATVAAAEAESEAEATAQRTALAGAEELDERSRIAEEVAGANR